ncbi:hypothetical protein ABZ770_36165 [Streptomyces sp. NPDC006654]|uniref:hypothetical protein n=1 Tax=Streptomyces sp. NPDC006654 TaxID=3156897 RepID=UPI0033C40EC9
MTVAVIFEGCTGLVGELLQGALHGHEHPWHLWVLMNDPVPQLRHHARQIRRGYRNVFRTRQCYDGAALADGVVEFLDPCVCLLTRRGAEEVKDLLGGIKQFCICL